jgi:MFS family permease
VSHLSSLADRSSIFAWYILFSAAGTAGGTLFSGWLVQHLQENCAWTALDSYRIIFWVYAALGVVKFLLCLAMSSESEPLKKLGATTTPCSSDETRPLLRDDTDTQNHRNGQVKDNQKPGPDWNSCNPQQQRQDTTSKPKISLFPKISSESKAVVVKLCFLFALDAIASGLAPVSWMIAFFNRKFDLAEGPLGSALFVTSILSSALNLVASSISRHIGLIKAMVITHLPASITLALIPIPGSVVIAMTLLIFRMSIKDMDMVPRQAFVAAAVLPDERTAVMGIVNIVRTLAISIGPVITGALAGNGQFWIAFVIAGCLKVAYNVLIVAMFWNYSTQEERALVERDGYADIQGR